MKQYTIGEAIDIAINAGMKEPKVLFASDFQKALVEAFEAGKRQDHIADFIAGRPCATGEDYARRVMEEKE